MDRDFASVHKHAKKELGQYPAILTSRLFNNQYRKGRFTALIMRECSLAGFIKTKGLMTSSEELENCLQEQSCLVEQLL